MSHKNITSYYATAVLFMYAQLDLDNRQISAKITFITNDTISTSAKCKVLFKSYIVITVNSELTNLKSSKGKGFAQCPKLSGLKDVPQVHNTIKLLPFLHFEKLGYWWFWQKMTYFILRPKLRVLKYGQIDCPLFSNDNCSMYSKLCHTLYFPFYFSDNSGVLDLSLREKILQLHFKVVSTYLPK